MSHKSEKHKRNQTKKNTNRPTKKQSLLFINKHTTKKWKKHVEKIMRQNKDYKFSKILSISKKTYKL